MQSEIITSIFLGLNSIPLNEIEILNNNDGVPQLKIKNYENLKTKVSLSHTSEDAIAFVLIEKT